MLPHCLTDYFTNSPERENFFGCRKWFHFSKHVLLHCEEVFRYGFHKNQTKIWVLSSRTETQWLQVRGVHSKETSAHYKCLALFPICIIPTYYSNMWLSKLWHIYHWWTRTQPSHVIQPQLGFSVRKES